MESYNTLAVRLRLERWSFPSLPRRYAVFLLFMISRFWRCFFFCTIDFGVSSTGHLTAGWHRFDYSSLRLVEACGRRFEDEMATLLDQNCMEYTTSPLAFKEFW